MIVRTAQDTLGVPFLPVGDPPTCHMAQLDGGAVMVLTDGLGTTDYMSLLQVAVYASEADWRERNDDHLSYADTVAAANPSEVERVVRDALSGAKHGAQRQREGRHLRAVPDPEPATCRHDDGRHGPCGGPSNGRECWQHIQVGKLHCCLSGECAPTGDHDD